MQPLGIPYRESEDVRPISLVDRAPAQRTTPTVHMEVVLSSLELTAQLLPSLRAKVSLLLDSVKELFEYEMKEARGEGQTGAEATFNARLETHVVYFTVKPRDRVEDTFTLQLPSVTAEGAVHEDVDEKARPLTGHTAKQLRFRRGAYTDVTVTIGE